MKTDQFVGYGLVIAVIVGVVGWAFDTGNGNADGFYTIAGILLYVFGIWAAVKLLSR